MGCGASSKRKYEAIDQSGEKEAGQSDDKVSAGDVANARADGASVPAKTGVVRGNRKPKDQKTPRSAAAERAEPKCLDWSGADTKRWEYISIQYNGNYSYHTKPVVEEVQGPIEEGLQKVRNDPTKYLGVYYQTNMTEWAAEQQKYNLVQRTKSGFSVKEDPEAPFTWYRTTYQALPAVDVITDGHTDTLTYKGNALPTPIHPGRGHGVADVPMIKVMDDVDPNDVAQGGVGDCWLLSAISSLGEFDGAIARLFKNTPDIHKMPFDHSNNYTVTLYELSTWEPVDIVVDERLCCAADGSGLLGCAPTLTGELWTCYLEKAIAIHCGGWDKIDGGQCTHAWRLLTGCKAQYTFRDTGEGFGCYGAFNPNTKEWEVLANSPHDGFRSLWPMEWPEVGGGGDLRLKIDTNEMFDRMCAWDDSNYIMCCGTKAGDDDEDTDGIVDGHAYTILDVVDNAGGTEFDMVKVRNPWGKGEFKSGMWDDDGPGWGQYPEVKEACKPVLIDDGVFWVDKHEFFQYFHTVYLCAKDMSEFLC